MTLTHPEYGFQSHRSFTSSIAQYTVSQKNCAKFFFSELRQISTNFDNFLAEREQRG